MHISPFDVYRRTDYSHFTTEAVIHIIFVIAHILCLIFGLVGLFVTIPLHIIVALMVGSGKKTDEQTELLKEQNEMLKKG